MVQTDSCRQTLWKGFLDGSLTPTTTTPDLLLEYDTTLAPCHYSSAKLQTHPSPQAIEFNRHPSRFSGKGSRAGKFTHPTKKKRKENTRGTPQTHTLMQTYSSHLLVLRNACHCLPMHQPICTTLSHRRRCIIRARTLLKQYRWLLCLSLEDSFYKLIQARTAADA